MTEIDPIGLMKNLLPELKLRILEYYQDSTKYRIIRNLKGHTQNVTALAVLSDGSLVSGSLDCTIKIWDTKTGDCLNTLSGHTH